MKPRTPRRKSTPTCWPDPKQARTARLKGSVVWSGVPDLRALLVPIGSLKCDPRNARAHPERNASAVKASLERFGQQKPVVCDPKSGEVIAGNATLDAARSLGWTHVARVRSTLKGAERTAYGIADNRSAELAAWNDEMLAELARDIGALEDPGMAEAIGFTEQELRDIGDPSGDDEGGGGSGSGASVPKIRCPKCGHRWRPDKP